MKKLQVEDMIAQPTDNIFNQLNQIDDKPSDEISMKAINELFNFKKIKSNSRVKMEQVTNLTKLFMFAETFKDNFTKQLAHNILQLQISAYGLGRKETVQLVQQRTQGFEIQQPIKTSKDIFK